MKEKGFQLVFIGFIILVMTSCKKVQGCMDSDADNFNGLAEEDDGTCVYSGGVVFYHEKETSENLTSTGITHLRYYVDDNFYDEVPAYVYFNYVPDCQNQTAFTIQNYGLPSGAKSKSFSYEIKDQDDNSLFNGLFVIRGGQCEVIKTVL